MLLSVLTPACSILVSSQAKDLRTAGQGGFTLQIQIINQSLLFNLRREERRENVWLVGEEGEMIKTEKQVKLLSLKNFPLGGITFFCYPYVSIGQGSTTLLNFNFHIGNRHWIHFQSFDLLK